MLRVRSIAIAITALIAGVGGSVANGQTTRPASESWSQAVNSLAGALTAADAAHVRGLLAEGAVVRPFLGLSGGGLAALMEQSELSGIVSSRAYRVPAASVATDLAEDFRACALIREDQKDSMIPADAIGFQRAETTATQWLKAMLAIEPGDQIGVIVLWIAQPGNELTLARPGRPLFVLVAGTAQAEKVSIRKIIFGDPLEGLKKTAAKKPQSVADAQY